MGTQDGIRLSIAGLLMAAVFVCALAFSADALRALGRLFGI